MTDVDGPRFARADEYGEMMDLLDRSFAYEREGMAARIPNCYDRTEMKNHAIVREDGRVVSHVAAVPQTLSTGERSVECWGIGGVATDKRYRGNGYMSDLLSFWLDRMAEADVPLSELGGNRQRYNHFGWERTGREVRYRLSERSFDGANTDAPIDHYDGAVGDAALVRELHSSDPLRVERDEELTRRILGQRGTETLLYRGDEPAYLSFTRERRDRIVEEFGGSEAGVLSLLDYLFSVYDVDGVSVFAHPRHRQAEALRVASASWDLQSHRMVNVVDLEGTLTGFAGQLADRWGRHGSGDLDLVLEVTGEGDPVRIAGSGSDLTVEPAADADADVALDRLSMTALLFGFHDRHASLKERHPALETLLPLDFYVWKSETV